MSILLHVSVQIFLRHLFPTNNPHGLGNDPSLSPVGFCMGLHDSQYPNSSDLSVWICQYCSTRSDWNQHDSCPQCSVCTRGRRRQTEKTVKDSTNCVLEMDHGETFPAIYLGQDVDVCFCEENNVTEVVVSHCEGGKLRMAMDEFQSQVNKREMIISCYALSDFSSFALDEEYEPSAYLTRLIKSTFPWLKTAKKEPKRTARSKLAADNADYMRKFQFMGGDLDSEQGILQTGLVIETVRGHTPGTKSRVGLYDRSDRRKHGNYCESSIFVARNRC